MRPGEEKKRKQIDSFPATTSRNCFQQGFPKIAGLLSGAGLKLFFLRGMTDLFETSTTPVKMKFDCF